MTTIYIVTLFIEGEQVALTAYITLDLAMAAARELAKEQDLNEEPPFEGHAFFTNDWTIDLHVNPIALIGA